LKKATKKLEAFCRLFQDVRNWERVIFQVSNQIQQGASGALHGDLKNANFGSQQSLSEKLRKTGQDIDILNKSFYNVGYNAIVRRSLPIWGRIA